MRLRSKLVRNLTPEEVARCSRMTNDNGRYPEGSAMLLQLRKERKYPRSSARVFLIEDPRRHFSRSLISWALLFDDERGDYWAYFRTRKSHRRQGHATRLFNLLSDRHPYLLTCWQPSSVVSPPTG